MQAGVGTSGGAFHRGASVMLALVMLFFWLGTLPIMVAIGATAQRAFGRFQRRLPLVAAGAAVAIGVLTMMGRLSVRPDAHARHTVHAAEVSHVAR